MKIQVYFKVDRLLLARSKQVKPGTKYLYVCLNRCIVSVLILHLMGLWKKIWLKKGLITNIIVMKRCSHLDSCIVLNMMLNTGTTRILLYRCIWHSVKISVGNCMYSDKSYTSWYQYYSSEFIFTVSGYEFGVSNNVSVNSLVRLPNEAIVGNISSLLVTAGTSLTLQINASKFTLPSRDWVVASVSRPNTLKKLFIICKLQLNIMCHNKLTGSSAVHILVRNKCFLGFVEGLA